MTENDNTLADRLDAARERSEAMASSASQKAREFIHDHPVASIAGGIAIGALIAGLFAQRRRPTTYAQAGASAIDAGTARLGKLATLGAELALAYVAKAASAGKDGAGKIEDRLGEQLSQLGENGAEVSRKLTGLAEVALTSLREAGEAALQRMNRKHD